ncbi:MAG: sugar phosphate isomerase/epimerase [Firmicutes bacterium]|nr:sugar phosphate isomerase/epimerase [Bacillota bacterium]
MVVTLSAFGDEIGPTLTEQIQALVREGIRFVEVRSVNHTNIAELTEPEVDAMREALDAAGIGVSAIGSPIGKSLITEDEGVFRARFLRILDYAQRLGTARVRVFSFYLPEPSPETYRPRILDRFLWMVDRAAQKGITLLHENEKGIYGDTPERCLDLLNAVAAPTLRAVFDPANFIQVGVRPFPDAYHILQDHIAYVHVKDARFADGGVCVAGAGDGRWDDLVAALAAHQFEGFFSLEPHLAAGSEPGGGAAKFHEAARALKSLLAQQDVEVR